MSRNPHRKYSSALFAAGWGVAVGGRDKKGGLFHSFDYAAYRTQDIGLPFPAANFVFGQEDDKQRWFEGGRQSPNPDMREEAIRLVLDQAERLSDVWTNG